MADDLSWTVAKALLELCKARVSPVPGLTFVAPGQAVAWDNCCEDGGQLWVRIQRIAPRVKSPRGAGPNCAVDWWEVTYAIGTIRCAHTIDDEGVAPSAFDRESDALQENLDMAAIRDAMLCDAGSIRGILNMTLGSWSPTGPNGGCVGGEWTVTANISACGC